MDRDKITIVTGCAVDEKIYYVSCRASNGLIDDPYSRLFFYQEETTEKWFYHDRPSWKIVSTCFKPASSTSERAVCALSDEGDVEILMRSKTTTEKISDAGLLDESGIGYVTRIKYIGDDLYACGDQNQVYKRNNGLWSHIDGGILNRAKPKFSANTESNRRIIVNALKESSCLFDIAGASHDDIYAVGTNGGIFHYNGQQWEKFKTITAADLYGIYVGENHELLIAGSNGTILSGNKTVGFKIVSRKHIDADFISITQHNNQIFIGASDGIYIKADSSITRQPLNIYDVSNIESIKNVLWAVSSKKIIKYENQQWTMIKHIDNP
ncbi:hypothetical protein D3C76_862630 [compost metagenome]